MRCLYNKKKKGNILFENITLLKQELKARQFIALLPCQFQECYLFDPK